MMVVERLRAAGCVFAEDEARLLLAEAPNTRRLREMVERRVMGTPLEHIVGWAGFHGLRVRVDPGVFVPRRRTELLVRQAVELMRDMPRAVVLDLCCGSGAVGMALIHELPTIELHAADLDPMAVRCAARNVGDRGTVHLGDLYEAFPSRLRGRVDLVIANAPYVPTSAIAQLPSEARDHEPRTALDGGQDGLDVLRRVAASAGDWLAPTGRLVVETSRHQVGLTVEAARRYGFATSVVHSPELDATAVIGRVA